MNRGTTNLGELTRRSKTHFRGVALLTIRLLTGLPVFGSSGRDQGSQDLGMQRPQGVCAVAAHGPLR